MKAKANYNKAKIMQRAWQIFKSESNTHSFGECLRQSWNIAKNGTKQVDFKHIYDKHYTQVLNYINSRINYKNEIAQELTQDVFLQVSKHVDKYDVYKAKVTTWLFTIANNKIIDYFRANKNAGNISHVDGWTDENGKETFSFESSYYVEGIEEHEMQATIKTAMSGLNEKEQSIAIMYFMEDRQYNEIAETLDIPMGTIKGMISRIRTKLQNKLKNVQV